MNIRTMVSMLLSAIGVLFIVCTPTGNDNEKDPAGTIEGKYLLTTWCMNHYTRKGLETMPLPDSTLYQRIEGGCSNGMIDVDSLFSMSTLIITHDSIVRFGIHCPGDSSGFTRIAYGYRLHGDTLVGDSLSGEIVFEGNAMFRTTIIEKKIDGAIVMYQHGVIVENSIDSTFYSCYKGTYKRYETVPFAVNDKPTCSDNYSPWFPIPFW